LIPNPFVLSAILKFILGITSIFELVAAGVIANVKPVLAPSPLSVAIEVAVA
tara:strand:- start:292 stop:447 length:156 start_codon:yes stop_codon:yes gene_type:complete